MVLNAAARLVVGANRYDHISRVLRDVLHWLLVTQRIQFKIVATSLFGSLSKLNLLFTITTIFILILILFLLIRNISCLS